MVARLVGDLADADGKAFAAQLDLARERQVFRVRQDLAHTGLAGVEHIHVLADQVIGVETRHVGREGCPVFVKQAVERRVHPADREILVQQHHRRRRAHEGRALEHPVADRGLAVRKRLAEGFERPGDGADLVAAIGRGHGHGIVARGHRRHRRVHTGQRPGNHRADHQQRGDHRDDEDGAGDQVALQVVGPDRGERVFRRPARDDRAGDVVVLPEIGRMRDNHAVGACQDFVAVVGAFARRRAVLFGIRDRAQAQFGHPRRVEPVDDAFAQNLAIRRHGDGRHAFRRDVDRVEKDHVHRLGLAELQRPAGLMAQQIGHDLGLAPQRLERVRPDVFRGESRKGDRDDRGADRNQRGEFNEHRVEAEATLGRLDVGLHGPAHFLEGSGGRAAATARPGEFTSGLRRSGRRSSRRSPRPRRDRRW